MGSKKIANKKIEMQYDVKSEKSYGGRKVESEDGDVTLDAGRGRSHKGGDVREET